MVVREQGSWKYDVLDNNFQNMKSWLEGCAKKYGWDGTLTIRNIYKMTVTLQQMEKSADDAILKAFEKDIKEPN